MTEKEITPEVQRWIKFTRTKENPVCVGCGQIPEEFYQVNPPGGFGRSEVRLGLCCLHKPEFRGMYNRLLEHECLEERDKLHGQKKTAGRG